MAQWKVLWWFSSARSQLSIEEEAKAFLLIEKSIKREPLSEKDWRKFTKGASAHQIKLQYMQKVDDDSMAKQLSKIGINYYDILRKRWTAEGLKNIEKYWNKISEAFKNYRFAHLYVDYDFEARALSLYTFMIALKISNSETLN